MKRFSFLVVLLIVVAVAVFAAVVVDGDRADAYPSYATQTGEPCGTCHGDGALTAIGTAFAAGGYVWPLATTTTTTGATTTTTTGEGTTTTTGSTTSTVPSTTSTTLPTGVISVTG